MNPSRSVRQLAAVAVLATSALVVSGTPPQLLRAQAGDPAPLAVGPRPIVYRSVKHDLSPRLDLMPLVQPVRREVIAERTIKSLPSRTRLLNQPIDLTWRDPVAQLLPGLGAMPSPLVNFEGVHNVSGVLPPDTQGDVGPDRYVQWVNLAFAIYDKAGTKLYGPANGNSLWQGFGGPCESTNHGDPITLYDAQANRWMMSQFSVSGPYYQCIAVSKTGDPTGAWYRYQWQVPVNKMNDYPHFGVWPDGYYMAVNQFTGGVSWGGQGAVAFERSKMLLGQPAQAVYFDLYGTNPNLGGMLPTDIDGSTPPPAGSPNYFMEVDDSWSAGMDYLQVFKFHVDWAAPANSTFTQSALVNLTTLGYGFSSNMCGYARNCIPQPGTTQKLDAIPDRLMYRLAYRNFGDHASVVVNHTVDVNGADHAGVRWYEIRDPGSATPTIYQAGTYAPDTDHRWMGSVAMDHDGNMALGFTVSSGATYPSIRYVGRLASDPLGQMSQSEVTLVAGSGSQTHSAARWGDYSMMSIDPVDDCTFWYTQEYMASTSSAAWQTRVGSFKFTGCAAAGQASSFKGKVTKINGTLIVGATIEALQGGLVKSSTTTGPDGRYALPIGAGKYDLRASALDFITKTKVGLTVLSSQVRLVNFVLRQTGFLQGTVTTTAAGHAAIGGATVEIRKAGALITSTTTDGSGHYGPIELPPGSYTVKLIKTGFWNKVVFRTVSDGTTLTADLAMRPRT